MSTHGISVRSDDATRAPEQYAARNRVLHALPPDEYEWLASRLEPVELRLGAVLAEAEEPFRHVYFPETSVASVVNIMADGSIVEVGTIGREGMVGLSVFLDAGATPSRTVVQIAGAARRMDASTFAAELGERPTLQRMLHRYTHAYLTQVAQTAACNRMHNIGQRCARWLLMTHDRAGEDTFSLTQEFLSFMLGVRRAGVTEAAGALQAAGLIRYSRGRVSILDRPGLEDASCECYRIVRDHFERLFT
jgi:CRP-like cAMP-binding protein